MMHKIQYKQVEVVEKQAGSGAARGLVPGSRIKYGENASQAQKSIVLCGYRAFFARKIQGGI
jgi:hypothetical protein